MNELRAEHERQIYDQNQELEKKLQNMQAKFELDNKKMQLRLKEEIGIKNEKIKELERQQQRDKVLRERAESTIS